jgi:hypothetical protein
MRGRPSSSSTWSLSVPCLGQNAHFLGIDFFAGAALDLPLVERDLGVPLARLGAGVASLAAGEGSRTARFLPLGSDVDGAVSASGEGAVLRVLDRVRDGPEIQGSDG